MSSSRVAFVLRLLACFVFLLLAAPARASAMSLPSAMFAQTGLNIAWGNYIVDILLIAVLAGLALFVICRSSRRV